MTNKNQSERLHEKNEKNLQTVGNIFHAKKLSFLFVLFCFSVFNNGNLANSQETLFEFPEKDVQCVVINRTTAEAVNWKNPDLDGRRNDCGYDIEIAQFSRSDGVAVIRASVKPDEIFAIKSYRALRNGKFAACFSPLVPILDLEARLEFRCVKKTEINK